MRGFAVVFRREVQERRLLLLMALLLGLVPLIVPLVPGVGSSHPSDLRQATAVGLMLIASLSLALLLGATGIAGDLMAGRMSFYFSRPLAAWTIWAGKLAAMFGLVLSVSVLIVLPTLLIEGFSAPSRLVPSLQGFGLALDSASLVPWVVVVVLVLLGAHFLAVSIRSRSPWLALDLAGLVVTAGVTASVWRACLREGLVAFARFRPDSGRPVTLLAWMFGGLGLALVLALLIAGALQVSAGRIDPRRGHRMQSLVLWSLVVPVLAGLVGLSRWAVAATPGKLAQVEMVQLAPRGPWMAVHGPVRNRPGFYSSLVVDPESGRFARTRAAVSPAGAPDIRFTEDGRLAYWFEPQDFPGSPLELMTLDLTDPAPRPRATGAVFSAAPTGDRLDFLLSPDGRRLAFANGRRLTVEELATHALLVAQEFETDDPYHARTLQFEGPDRLRLDVLNQYQYRASMPNLRRLSRWEETASDRDKAQVTLYEADLSTGRLTKTGRVESSLDVAFWERSPDGERGALFGRNALEVRDGRTGELISTIAGRSLFARFFPGGLLVVQRAAEGREVLLFDRDGRQERARLSLPGMVLVAIREGVAGEPLQLFVRRRLENPGFGGTADWQRWRIEVHKGVFEPLPDRRLYLLGGGSAWNPAAMRQADGVASVFSFSESPRVFLNPGR